MLILDMVPQRCGGMVGCLETVEFGTVFTDGVANILIPVKEIPDRCRSILPFRHGERLLNDSRANNV